MPGPSSSAASRVWLSARREPFRLLFPLGALLGAVGVGHWITYARSFGTYPGGAHAVVQVQAFLMAFGAGFLLTMLQRRAGGLLAPSATLAGMATGLVLVTWLSFRGDQSLAQACFLVVLGLLAERAIRLSRNARAGLPPAFVLVPIGLLQAAVGSLLLLMAPLVSASWPGLVGRWLVGEGCWLCLALGVGHVIMPMLTGHEPHASHGKRFHAAVGLAIGASFVLQHALTGWSPRWAVTIALGLRACIVTWEIAGCMRLRRPRLPGTHRTLAWLAFWILPAGLAAAAAMPSRRVALLHLVFIGGFSLMTFAVAAHVIASHGGYESLLTRPSRVVRAVGLLVLAGMATRVAADFLPGRAHWSHLAFAAAAWIVALAAWMAFLVPKAIRPIRRNDGGPELVQVALPRPAGSPPGGAPPAGSPRHSGPR